ncbi:MAG: outer membrane beta-barrel protein [Flavobacteriales bacterium]
MKIKILILSCFLYQCLSAQIDIGIRTGVLSTNFDIKHYDKSLDDIKNGDKELGFHIGAILRIAPEGKKMIFELDPSFVNTTSTFTLTDQDQAIQGILIEDQSWRADLPIMVGLRFAGFLDVMAGPTLSLNLSNDLSFKGTAAEIETNYEDTTLGFQVGAGVKISKFIVDVRYAASIESMTSGITINGVKYETDAKPSALIGSLSLLL